MRTYQGILSFVIPNWIARLNERLNSGICSLLFVEHRGLLWLGWRPPILVEMVSLPPTTASDGSTSICLRASSWTWLWLCLLRAFLSSKCQYREDTIGFACDCGTLGNQYSVPPGSHWPFFETVVFTNLCFTWAFLKMTIQQVLRLFVMLKLLGTFKDGKKVWSLHFILNPR